MEQRLNSFLKSYRSLEGSKLSNVLDPRASGFPPLKDFYRGANAASIRDVLYTYISDPSNTPIRSHNEADGWVELFAAFWNASGLIATATEAEKQRRPLEARWGKVFDAWKDVVTTLIRGYTNYEFEAWTIPLLYVAGRYLRLYAIKADAMPKDPGLEAQNVFQDDIVEDSGKNEKLEEAARVINRIFQICLSDRAPLDDSRKWGIYYTTNLLFKTYFKLNSIGLSKNILKALRATHTDMPPLESFPKSHVVTFKYYVGVIYFLEEDYETAEKSLQEAYNLCPSSSKHNLELILTYLVPCRLLTVRKLPSISLLAPYPKLQRRFAPLFASIREGNLAAFDDAMAESEADFVRRRIYLTLERGRDIALRNLLRKVFIEGGWEASPDGQSIRRTRIPVREFGVAISLAQMGGRRKGRAAEEVGDDEVECLLANMIYKNLMKGYISRERSMVVLSKGGAFPGTGV